MPATKQKKRSAKGKAAKGSQPNGCVEQTADSDSSRRWRSAAVALGGAALAIGCTRLNNGSKSEVALTPKDLLARVQRSGTSFDLAEDAGNRTLLATADIPANAVLMDIPRELMIWDLDAARDEFVQSALFDSPLFAGRKRDSPDNLSKRAALLSAYLSLLRSGMVAPSRSFPMQSAVARALPSYEEYAEFHPVLADLGSMERLLGGKSLAYTHLVQVRESLDKEYAMLGDEFASYVSREEYLSCRLAVLSRAFRIANVPEADVSPLERSRYKQKLGIDFGVAVSIEPVIDWMNTHRNNNVKVGGYNAATRSGQAWTIKAIGKGEELVNNYGDFYDHVLLSQYGFIPTDGTGTFLASMAVHHDIISTGEMIGGTTLSLPPLEKMAPYLQYDYGYDKCITSDDHDEFALKRLKLEYLQKIAIDSSRWVLPLPSRSSTTSTPISTTALPSDYSVPGFGPDADQYLHENALSISLPCRLITLTERDVNNASVLLEQDLRILRGVDTPHNIATVLNLEEIEISMNHFIRTMQCMQKLVSVEGSSIQKQRQYINDIMKAGGVNTLEWNAAHMKLEELQSQQALESFTSDVLESIFSSIEVVPEDFIVRQEHCHEEHTIALLLN